MGCAPRGHRGRGFGMGTASVEMAHLNNQCSRLPGVSAASLSTRTRARSFRPNASLARFFFFFANGLKFLQ